MALTRAQYLGHFRAALRHGLIFAYGEEQSPDLQALYRGLIDFVPNGPGTIEGAATTLANRRECVRILFTLLWKGVLNKVFNGHYIRHFLLECGVDYSLTEDVPELDEPTV